MSSSLLISERRYWLCLIRLVSHMIQRFDACTQDRAFTDVHAVGGAQAPPEWLHMMCSHPSWRDTMLQLIEERASPLTDFAVQVTCFVHFVHPLYPSPRRLLARVASPSCATAPELCRGLFYPTLLHFLSLLAQSSVSYAAC